jgi:WD40 repeat protein
MIDGKKSIRLEERGRQVDAVLFSPNGKLLVVGGGDRTGDENNIHIWDVNTKKLLYQLRGHQKAISTLAFSPDGNCFLSGSLDKTICLWKVDKVKPIRRFRVHTSQVISVAYAPDGKVFASLDMNSNICLVEIATGKVIRRLQDADIVLLSSVVFSPDGQVLAAAGWKTIHFWETATGKKLPALRGHQDSVTCVAFSPDGKQLASGSWDKTIRLWDTRKQRQIAVLSAHAHGVSSLAFSADGKTLVSGSSDCTICVWDVKTGRERIELPGHRGRITGLSFSPDGRKVASASADCTIRSWDVHSGRELQRFVGHAGVVTTVAFSPCGRFLASGEWRGAKKDTTIILWEEASGKPVRRMKGHTDEVVAVVFSADGKRIASLGRDAIRLWDVMSGKEILTLKEDSHLARSESIAISPGGELIATASTDDVLLWDSKTGKKVFQSLQKNGWGGSAIRFIGKTMLCSMTTDGTIRRWEIGTKRELLPIVIEGLKDYPLSISLDGRVLALGSRSGRIVLWETSTGTQIRQFHAPSGIGALSFSPDGRTLASSTHGDYAILLWDLTGRYKTARPAQPKLTSHDLSLLWIDLARQEASVAYRAIWKMVAGHDQSVPFLRKHLQTVSSVDPKRILTLLKDLEHDSFPRRQRATKELKDIRELAEPILLQRLEEKPSLECRLRIEQLLKHLRSSSERWRIIRAIAVLESVNNSEARKLLHELAQGVDAAWATQEAKSALHRLAVNNTAGPRKP